MRSARGVSDVDGLEDDAGDEVGVGAEPPTVMFLTMLLLTVKLYS